MAEKEKKKQAEAQRAVLYPLSTASDAIKLRRDATIFGREKGDVLISDSEVSSTHCQIQNVNGTYFLFDMNSTNGTFHNKAKIVKVKLSDGDIITIGKSSFRFSLQEDAKVRHISTIFKSAKQDAHGKTSLVDTLIEGEIRQRGVLLILNITYGDGTSEEISLPQKVIYLGRATSFGKFEEDPEISRKHILVKLNDHGEIFVEDQGSTNGTYINGNKVNGMHRVKSGDVVSMGKIQIKMATKSS